MVSVQEFEKPDEPKRSYSKFRKAKVEKMAFDSSVLQAEMEKAYPGFTFLDAEVKHNGVNAAFYIYARMVKKGEKPKGKPQKESEGTKHENYLHTKPKGRMCQDHNGGQHGGVIGNRV